MADYISREAAIKAIMEHTGMTPIAKLAAETAICRVPAADVRPVVRGRWEDETGYIFNQLAQRVYCPVCKSYAYFYPITTKNFCPNCGADMRPERGTKE